MTSGPGTVARQLAKQIAYCPEPHKSVHLIRLLSDALQRAGWSGLACEEVAEAWASRFAGMLDDELAAVWQSEGVETPLEPATAPHVMIGPAHPGYQGNIGIELFHALEVVRQADDKDLGLLGAVALAGMGATEVHYVDAANDAGVDVVASWLDGPAHGLCLCLQAKAWTGGLSGQHVEDAVDKYSSGFIKPAWAGYRKFVRAEELPGLGRTFIILSRDGFGKSGLVAGRNRGAACWGPRRLSDILARSLPTTVLRSLMPKLRPLARDPALNLASVIRGLMAESQSSVADQSVPDDAVTPAPECA